VSSLFVVNRGLNDFSIFSRSVSRDEMACFHLYEKFKKDEGHIVGNSVLSLWELMGAKHADEIRLRECWAYSVKQFVASKK